MLQAPNSASQYYTNPPGLPIRKLPYQDPLDRKIPGLCSSDRSKRSEGSLGEHTPLLSETQEVRFTQPVRPAKETRLPLQGTLFLWKIDLKNGYTTPVTNPTLPLLKKHHSGEGKNVTHDSIARESPGAIAARFLNPSPVSLFREER